MTQQKTRRILRLMLMLTGVSLLAGFVAWLLLHQVWPAHYFVYYPLIPVYFWVTGAMMIVILVNAHSEKPGSTTMLYMLVRTVKLLLTGLFVGGYAWLVNDAIKEFGFTTLLFYVLFLTLESYVYFVNSKRMMRERMDHKTVV